MSSRNPRLDTFYSEQVAAYHKAYTRDASDARVARESALDHTQNASAVITGAILLLTVLVSYCSPDGTFPGAFSAVGGLLWDGLVFAIPAPLLFALDSWLDSSSSSPSSSRQRPMRDARRSSHAAKSEALGRVMGLDRPGGVMSSIFRARARALSVTGSVLGLKVDHERPPGLGNRDNSCYQNSILQGLASLSSMPDYLSTCMHGTDLSGKEAGKNVAQTLRTLISDLNDTANNGRTLWTPSLLKSMSTWTQQDAQEYYSVILNDIDKGAALAVKEMTSGRILGLEGVEPLDADRSAAKDEGSASDDSDDSGYQSSGSSAARLPDAKTVRNPLEGLLAQRVSCVQCGHSDGLSMVPFNCLTLSLGLDKHHHDLYERLDSYSKVETIEGVDCPKCTLLKAQRLLGKLVEKLWGEGVREDKLAEPLRRLEAVEAALEEDRFDEATLKTACKIPTRVSTTKTKQMVIARPPQSLVVHVNRSVFDPSTFNMIKNSAPVNFPMVLDLGPWCLGSAEHKGGVSRAATMTTSTTSTTTSTINGDMAPADQDEDSEEQWELDPMVSMVAGDLGPSRLAGPIYELRAAVTHYGRHENGHYICYRKYPPYHSPSSEPEGTREAVAANSTTGERQGDWWRLSDHNVSKVDEELVMSLAPGVFMLFYECVDPSMILQPAVDEKRAGAREGSEATLAGSSSPVAERARQGGASRGGEAQRDAVRGDGDPEHGDASSEGTVEGEPAAAGGGGPDNERAAAGDDGR
ncbi:Ubiquitin carboxyl-terminal hydrolase 1 [Escovopsis weberi]|uniref:ubiquitinyl hydrolase 1 n=1 Tax=Escovopsis weberi TaxID=150374 RepID=A0A0M8MTV5_ESCWE|nr:Ubiquitin carboxyl-terminal hydrolase 1 [Escovopsis weberi]